MSNSFLKLVAMMQFWALSKASLVFMPSCLGSSVRPFSRWHFKYVSTQCIVAFIGSLTLLQILAIDTGNILILIYTFTLHTIFSHILYSKVSHRCLKICFNIEVHSYLVNYIYLKFDNLVFIFFCNWLPVFSFLVSITILINWIYIINEDYQLTVTLIYLWGF